MAQNALKCNHLTPLRFKTCHTCSGANFLPVAETTLDFLGVNVRDRRRHMIHLVSVYIHPRRVRCCISRLMRRRYRHSSLSEILLTQLRAELFI